MIKKRRQKITIISLEECFIYSSMKSSLFLDSIFSKVKFFCFKSQIFDEFFSVFEYSIIYAFNKYMDQHYPKQYISHGSVLNGYRQQSHHYK